VSAGRAWSFDGPFLVGRRSSAELNLAAPDDDSVSRTHAHVWHDGRDWWVADLGSTNGTWLNGVRLGRQPAGPLRPADLVQFAKQCMRVESVEAADRGERPRSEAAVRDAIPGVTGGFPFGEVLVGPPVRNRWLAVYPLSRPDAVTVDYVLAAEAVAAGAVTVTEVSEQGSVPELRVDNHGDVRVLFLEGEELRGGKQNRVLNTSVLVPARSSVVVPVSCVEQYRWRLTSDHSHPSGTVCPPQLRHTLKASVTRSLRASRGHQSDQNTIWWDVRTQHEALGVTSDTSSLEDTFVSYESHLADARQALDWVEGSSGLAVAIGPRIVSADLFDRPATCRQVWDGLLSGLLLDGLTGGSGGPAPDPAEVRRVLDDALRADWTPTPAVGEGQEHRAEFGGRVASALTLQGALVHFSVVGRRRAGERGCGA
jgi:hypothetical protein